MESRLIANELVVKHLQVRALSTPLVRGNRGNRNVSFWYRQLEDQIIGNIDREQKKSKKKGGAVNELGNTSKIKHKRRDGAGSC